MLTITVDQLVKGNNYWDKDTQITILTMDPCFRTIFVHGNFTKLPFPYLNFVFRYRKVPGGFCYPGLGGAGFGVYFSKKPLGKNVKLSFSPTENWTGIVCTNHAWDGKVFYTRKEMFNTMIDFWIGVNHAIYFDDVFLDSGYRRRKRQPSILSLNSWQKMTLEEVTKYDWPKSLHNPINFKPVEYIDKPIKL